MDAEAKKAPAELAGEKKAVAAYGGLIEIPHFRFTARRRWLPRSLDRLVLWQPSPTMVRLSAEPG